MMFFLVLFFISFSSLNAMNKKEAELLCIFTTCMQTLVARTKEESKKFEALKREQETIKSKRSLSSRRKKRVVKKRRNKPAKKIVKKKAKIIEKKIVEKAYRYIPNFKDLRNSEFVSAGFEVESDQAQEIIYS
jgi:hypothetical protein